MQKPLTTEVTVKWMCAGGCAPACLSPADEALNIRKDVRPQGCAPEDMRRDQKGDWMLGRISDGFW